MRIWRHDCCDMNLLRIRVAVRDAARDAIDRLWSGPDRPATSDAAVQWLTRRALRGLVEASDRFVDSSFGDTLRQAVSFAEDAVQIDPRDVRARLVRLACRSAIDAEAAGSPGEDERIAALDLAIQAEKLSSGPCTHGT